MLRIRSGLPLSRRAVSRTRRVTVFGMPSAYQGATIDQAEEYFLGFRKTWGKKYPAIIRLWENARAESVPFLLVDREIRRVVRTTNAIESAKARELP